MLLEGLESARRREVGQMEILGRGTRSPAIRRRHIGKALPGRMAVLFRADRRPAMDGSHILGCRGQSLTP